VVNVKDRVFAEDTVFDDGGQCGATMTPESMVWSRSPISSSSVKVMAAMGAVEGRGDAGRHADRGQAMRQFLACLSAGRARGPARC